jgi:large subunit ribosomal protein L4
MFGFRLNSLSVRCLQLRYSTAVSTFACNDASSLRGQLKTKMSLHSPRYCTTVTAATTHGTSMSTFHGVPEMRTENTGVKPAPLLSQPIEVPVIDFISKQPRGNFALSRDVFGAPLRVDILHRVVVWQLDKRRQGTHKAKTRSEVRGGGRKPWAQKGTGRARAGSIRAPHWRGGGKVFPPTPRSHATKLPKKIRALGMKVALSTKLSQGKLKIVENLQLPDHKTKNLRHPIVPREWGTVLMVEKDQSNENLSLASGNLQNVHILPQIGLNVYDILCSDTLVITKDAVESLQQRIINQHLGFNTRRLLAVKQRVKESIEAHKAQLKIKEEQALNNEAQNIV